MRARRLGLLLPLLGLVLLAACVSVAQREMPVIMPRDVIPPTATLIPVPAGIHAWVGSTVSGQPGRCIDWVNAGLPEAFGDAGGYVLGDEGPRDFDAVLIFCNTSAEPITVTVSALVRHSGYSQAGATYLNCDPSHLYCDNPISDTGTYYAEGYHRCAFNRQIGETRGEIARDLVVLPYRTWGRIGFNVWRIYARAGASAPFDCDAWAEASVSVQGPPPPGPTATPTATATPTITLTPSPTRTRTPRPTATYCPPGRCPENPTRTPTATRVPATVTPSATYCPPERCFGGTPIPTPTYCAPENCP